VQPARRSFWSLRQTTGVRLKRESVTPLRVLWTSVAHSEPGRFNVIDLPIDRGLEPTTQPERARAINGRAVRTTVCWVVGLVVIVHGSIHFLGAVKGLGWVDVTQLAGPISTGLGAVWLSAALVTIAAGVLLLARVRWWWLVGAVAVVVSRVVIVRRGLMPRPARSPTSFCLALSSMGGHRRVPEGLAPCTAAGPPARSPCPARLIW